MNVLMCAITFLYYVSCEKLFKSVPVIVKSYENDTVLLPCYVDDTESNLRVRWYKNDQLLGDSVDSSTVLPHRFKMHHNYSLEVVGIQSVDTADYTCEIIRPEPWTPIRQTHTIEVQNPPSIVTIPEDGILEVKKGEYVDIGCDATGTPKPIITWKKNGEVMALLEHRARLRFRAEHRALGGTYQCTAYNTVGEPANGYINVVIQDAPIVTAVRSFVHSAIGLRAALRAAVAPGAPPPRTHWLRAGARVRTDDRVVIIVQDNIHQLIFRSVRQSDFGNYTFRAENSLGMADVSFKLTGIPNVASFKVDRAWNQATATSFKLIWEVDSYSTIIEYNLWLRPYYGRVSTEHDSFTTETVPNHWSKIVVPGDSAEGPIHSAVYTVRGLTPSTVYEAVVTSRNRFGWSQPSAVLRFATEPGVLQKQSTSFYADYTDITPILEDIEPEAHNISQASILGRTDELSSAKARETYCAAILFISAMCLLIS